MLLYALVGLILGVVFGRVIAAFMECESLRNECESLKSILRTFKQVHQMSDYLIEKQSRHISQLQEMLKLLIRKEADYFIYHEDTDTYEPVLNERH